MIAATASAVHAAIGSADDEGNEACAATVCEGGVPETDQSQKVKRHRHKNDSIFCLN